MACSSGVMPTARTREWPRGCESATYERTGRCLPENNSSHVAVGEQDVAGDLCWLATEQWCLIGHVLHVTNVNVAIANKVQCQFA